MHGGDNPSFSDEFTKFTFFLDSSIHIQVIVLEEFARVCLITRKITIFDNKKEVRLIRKLN
jgi:hypothetical protein